VNSTLRIIACMVCTHHKKAPGVVRTMHVLRVFSGRRRPLKFLLYGTHTGTPRYVSSYAVTPSTRMWTNHTALTKLQNTTLLSHAWGGAAYIPRFVIIAVISKSVDIVDSVSTWHTKFNHWFNQIQYIWCKNLALNIGDCLPLV